MEKLKLYERLLKNKNRLKVQAVSLLLATTAVITTGCGKTEKPNMDNPQTDIVDVVDNDIVEEEMVPLSIENLDSEAEKITDLLTKKGIEVSFEDVRRTLLILNKDSFAEDEFYSLYDVVTDFDKEPINHVFNEITIYNSSSIYDNNPNDLVNLKVFCRNADGYKVIEKLNYHSNLIAKIVVDNPRNLDSEIRKNLEPFYNLLDTGQIKIGNEVYSLENFDDGTKSLILQTGMFVYGYVNFACKSDYLTEDTKSYCDDVKSLCFIVCSSSYNHILDESISKIGQKTR